jgi:hypothetical protein
VTASTTFPGRNENDQVVTWKTIPAAGATPHDFGVVGAFWHID